LGILLALQNGDGTIRQLWSMVLKEYAETWKRILHEMQFNWSLDFLSFNDILDTCRNVVCKLKIKNKLITERNGTLFIDLEDKSLGKGIIQDANGIWSQLFIDAIAILEHEKHDKFIPQFLSISNAQECHHYKKLTHLIYCIQNLELENDTIIQKHIDHYYCGAIYGLLNEEIQNPSEVLNAAKTEMKCLNHDVESSIDFKTSETKDLQNIENSPKTVLSIQNGKDRAHTVGLSSLIVLELSYRRSKNYTLKWGQIARSAGGNAGIYLQYVHARLCG